jgi:hypothetical protein
MTEPDQIVVSTPKNIELENYTPESPGLAGSVFEEVSDVPASTNGNTTSMLPDGGALINFSGEDSAAAELATDLPFNGNLATGIEEGELTKMAMDLVELYEADKRSRADWMKTYKEGLPLLGFRIENRTEPWENACGVYHPVMAEAAVRFLASAMTETFPAKGPVKTSIIGKWTREKEKKAKRVQDEMNYQLTEVMKEYRAETEQVIWRMAIAGSAFRKVYFCPIKNRPTAMCVSPENMVVPYAATHLETCERFTHEVFYTENQVKLLQASGYFRAVDIPAPSYVPQNEVEGAKDKISGITPSVEVEDRHEILEMYVDMVIDQFPDSDGLPCPYIITIEKSSSTVLSIYRNWEEQDPIKNKIMSFVHYQYMPGFGFYGLGLINILGGLTKAATGMLRQSVDAGTLSNVRAGYKTRGLRIKNDNRPLAPGELRDIDTLSGSLRDNIYFPEFRGPSPELTALLGAIVDEARKLGSVSDMKVSEVSGDMPVGTILAIFERNMKVQSAVQARLHASMKEEFKILSGLISEYSARYDYEVDGDPAIIKSDFDPKIIDVLPVSDPNATTMSQRVIQHQAVMAMAKEQPQIYDIPELHRRALDIMGIKDPEKIIPDNTNQPPQDPITENMAILTGKPVKAFVEQDHESHIKIHMAMAEDPKIMQMMSQSPTAMTAAASMAAHVQEHIAFAYRRKIEEAMGVPLPPVGEPLPPEIEYDYSKAIADAADRVLSESKADLGRKKAEEALEDPVIKMQQEELDIKKMEAQRKIAKDQADNERANKQLGIKSLLELSRQASTERSFKAEVQNDSVQRQAERALKARTSLFDAQQNKESVGAKLLDRLVQEAGKQEIAKIPKKPLRE